MSRSRSALLTLFWLGGCTVLTEAKDFKVDDTAFHRDFDYTFVNMVPHASVAGQPGLPMELALLDVNGFAQSRARVYFPPRPAGGGDYPDVRLSMTNALWAGAYDMSFYVDDQPENYQLDTKDAARKQVLEHCWEQEVSSTGAGTFVHNTEFTVFDNPMVIGDDVLIKATTPAFNPLCVSKALSEQIKETVEIQVFRIEENNVLRQMGLFKTFAGVTLPEEIKLHGIVDRGSDYRIVIVRDGESKTIEKPGVDGDIVLETKDWIELPSATLLGCRN